MSVALPWGPLLAMKSTPLLAKSFTVFRGIKQIEIPSIYLKKGQSSNKQDYRANEEPKRIAPGYVEVSESQHGESRRDNANYVAGRLIFLFIAGVTYEYAESSVQANHTDCPILQCLSITKAR